ncbi:monooxygenase [Frankia sp. CcI49]|uniref:FAD-dependent monooxygenase n=1 Tax=Frankia sp. CcI49 TaxID=1745382 RepID=UPI000977699F|nr:FAD-dependent monooxygenase [Frankia sp. CcI49]ONH52414.1 monooxygenase [Frankia sp. CcI49]
MTTPARKKEQYPVLVVGAGPVGLATALALRSFGAPVTLLEAREADATRPGSRALYVHGESLRLLGLADPRLAADLSEHGILWTARRTLFRGREVYAKQYPRPRAGRPGPYTSLRQVDTEGYLRAACARAGVDIRWGSPVVRLDAADDEVTVEVESGRSFTARYLIGADGPRSTIRRLAGIGMQGERSEGFHVTVDIADTGPDALPPERIFHYEHPGTDGRHLMHVPFPNGFQLDLQCRGSDRAEDFDSPEALARWLPKVVDGRYLESVLWTATYRFQRIVADSFVDPHGRILLVGEAAHLFPPLGARGMNSGFADGDEAARAVVLALAARSAGQADEAVRRFATTRRAAALRNSQAAGTALVHLQATRPILRTRQRTAAALAPWIPSCGTWLERAVYGPRRLATDTALAGRY